jgi:ABC-type transport system substrate-binding protein
MYDNTNLPASDTAALLQAYWKQVGITCNLKGADYATVYSTLRGKAQKDAIMLATSSCDALKCIRLQAIPGQSWNASMVNDPYANEKYALILPEKDIAKRAQMIKELNVYLISQAYWVFTPAEKAFHYAWPYVMNYYGEIEQSDTTCANIWATLWLNK